MLFKQIFIINSDLKMGKGKIVGQALHSMVYYMDEILLYVGGKLLKIRDFSKDMSRGEKRIMD